MRFGLRVLVSILAVGALSFAAPARGSAQTQGTRLLTAARAQLEELQIDSARRLLQAAFLEQRSLTQQQTAYAYVLLGVTELIRGNSAARWLSMAIREDSTVRIDSLLDLHSELLSQFLQARRSFSGFTANARDKSPGRRACSRVYRNLELDPAYSLALAWGDEIRIEARARDNLSSPCTPSSLSWRSSNVNVARVSESDGLVSAVGRGTAIITASGPRAISAQAVVAVKAGVPRDTDGDGVIDASDRCLNTPAGLRVDADGCPLAEPAEPSALGNDGDGDGVIDASDRCPNTAAGSLVDATGCLLAELPAVNAAPLVIPNITFRTGTSRLLPTSFAELDRLATALVATPNTRWEIGGHTDASGIAAANTRLSQDRAQAVMTYLASKGVPDSAMIAVGYGSTRPVAPNTAARRAQNRRVEIKRIQ